LLCLLVAYFVVPFHGSGLIVWLGITIFTVWYWNWASSGMSLRRKIQAASWAPSQDGVIYAKVSVDATNMLAWIEKKRQETGTKITMTHAVGKIVALCLKAAPDLNGYLFMGRFIRFQSVDIAFLTTVEGGNNLFHCKIDSCEKKKVVDIAQTLIDKSDLLRKNKDPDFQKTMDPAKQLPTWVLEAIFYIGGWLASSLGVSLPALGLKSFPFGACLLTSIGTLGIVEGYAPFTPFARTPLVVAIGALKKGVVIINDKMEIRPKIKIMATIDHRFLDGAQGAVFPKLFDEIFANPELLEQD